MKRSYTFFDKEDYKGRKITYEYPEPFYENMDADFRDNFGTELTFIKELNHRDKVIRMHSAYDSGKGTRYVAPVIVPRKKRRLNFDQRIQEILDFNIIENKRVLQVECEKEYKGESTFFIFYENAIAIFTRATRSENGSIGGYKMVIDKKPKALYNYLKDLNYYPDMFAWYD